MRFFHTPVSYPQDKQNTYEQLASLAAEQLSDDGAIVLAESFGGAVALTLAFRRPDLVRRLVLINTFAWFPRQPLIKLLALLGPYLPRRPASAWSRGIRGRFFFPPVISQSDRDAWWNLTADVPQRVYGLRLGLIAHLDLRPLLGEIEVPTIVFISPNDRIVPPCAGRLLAKRMPQAKLIAKPAGHAALIHPAVDVARFLEE